MLMTTFTHSAIRRAILAAFCLTAALNAPISIAAQDAGDTRIEQQIAALEQERSDLLAQIEHEGAKVGAKAGATTGQSRMSLFMLLGGLLGCAGAAVGIVSSMRKMQGSAVMAGMRERPLTHGGEHRMALRGNLDTYRQASVQAAIPAAATLAPIEYEAVHLPPVAARTISNTCSSRASVEDQFDPGEASAGAMEVSECLAPLPQAQFWACMCKPNLAIDILEPALDTMSTPHGWLLLLEMYTLTDRRSQYQALSLRFKTIFNAKVPAFDDYTATLGSRRLRDCPDLTQRINRILGKSGVVTYLRKLLLDDRMGVRRGFEMGVYCDLVRLLDTVCSGKKVADCEEIYA